MPRSNAGRPTSTRACAAKPRSLGRGQRSFAGVERVGERVSIGPLAHRVRSPVAPGAVLVGDAAGFINPFTGQGVFLALTGAEAAAGAMLAALRNRGVEAAAFDRYAAARTVTSERARRSAPSSRCSSTSPRWRAVRRCASGGGPQARSALIGRGGRHRAARCVPWRPRCWDGCWYERDLDERSTSPLRRR